MGDTSRIQVSPSDEEKTQALLERIGSSVENARQHMQVLDDSAQLAQGLIADFGQFRQNFTLHGRAPTKDDVVRFFEQYPEYHKLVVDVVLLLRGEVDSSISDDVNGRFSFAELISIVQEAKTGYRPVNAFRILRPKKTRNRRRQGRGGGGNNDQDQAARRAAQVRWNQEPLKPFLKLLKNLISKNGDNFFSRRLGPPLQHSVIDVCDMIISLENLSGPPKDIWEGYLRGVGAQAVANANANANAVPVAAAAAPAVDHRAEARTVVVQKKVIAKNNLAILQSIETQGNEDVHYERHEDIILTNLNSTLSQDVSNLDRPSQGFYRYNTDAKKDHLKRDFLKKLAKDFKSLNIAP